MRVLYVNQTAQVSGAERSLLTLLDGLGTAVVSAVACPDGALAEALAVRTVTHWRIAGTQASFRLHPLHTSRGLMEIARSSIEVRRIVARQQPDVVHANTTRASLLALLARSRTGPPVLAHIRDWAPDGRFSRFVLGVVARRADAVVANSAYIAAQFEGLPMRRSVQVIHNPVDLRRFDPNFANGSLLRRKLGISNTSTTLAVIAQLTPWKGQDDAIRILAQLLASGREVTLLLAGSPKFAASGTRFDNPAYERNLHALAAQLDVADSVHFLGERSDVPELLAATGVLLMPSWREAFGRVAIEGMAMGVPVVATEVGGPAEIIRSGIDGLLLPPRRAELWARELEPLIDDPEGRRRMGASGRARAALFSVPAHVNQMLEAYRGLLAERQSDGQLSLN